MIRRALSWWRAWERRFDVRTLWPACKANAPDLETARRAFLVHCALDAAWYAELTDEEVVSTVEGLS